MMVVLAMGDRPSPALRLLMAAHTELYRLSRGRIGHRIRGFPPMLLLDHVGARSAIARTSPLGYIADDGDIVVIASKGGHPRHPSWYHNLLANPDTTVQIGARRLAVHARVATAQERERLWPQVVATYAGYGGYQERTERRIPLVILTPRDAAPG